MNADREMDEKEKNHLLQQAAQLITQSSHMVVFTGAGISTPSGIPDFRSPDSGLWQKNDPFEVASIWAFQHQPRAFFDWIRPLAQQAESAEPNRAHHAIAILEKRGFVKAVITQNIDGLHQKAGSRRVLELHGSTQTATCSHCGKRHEKAYFEPIFLNKYGIPHCDQCGRVIKPDVVLFGEELPQTVWESAYQECLQADLLFIAGSSLEVSPANSLPETAARHGARLIINNLGRTHLDRLADVFLQWDVLDGLGALPDWIPSTAP